MKQEETDDTKNGEMPVSDGSRPIEMYCEENPNRLAPEQMDKIKEEYLHPKKGTISDEFLDYKLWCRELPSRQESFADYITERIPAGKGLRLLEVGGGKNGNLSRLLAEKGFRMTCMDPRLELGDDGEIRGIRESFDYRTADLSGYDYVVAQEPCEATEHIVRACTGQKVPFIMALCGVAHPLITGETLPDVYAWYRYLNQIDEGNTELKAVNLYYLASVAVISSTHLQVSDDMEK